MTSAATQTRASWPFATRWAVFAFSLALAGLAAEAVTRILGVASTAVVVVADAEAYERVPGVYLPSRTWTGVGRRLRFDVQINSLGYRGPEPRAGGDALRVVFVGDSFVFGDFVGDGETWPAQLQTRLGCDRPVVVYNAGVAGGTLTESVPMARRARVLRPDVIVGEFTAANDLDDLTGPSLWSRMESRRRVGPMVETAYRLLYRFALWNAVRQARTAIASWGRRLDPTSDPTAFIQAQHRYEELLSGWVDELRSVDIPLVFAVYPAYDALARGDRAVHDWAVEVAMRAGLRPVDLWPALYRDGRSPDELYLVPDDRHPSAQGYAVAAEAVANAVLAQVPAFTSCGLTASR